MHQNFVILQYILGEPRREEDCILIQVMLRARRVGRQVTGVWGPMVCTALTNVMVSVVALVPSSHEALIILRLSIIGVGIFIQVCWIAFRRNHGPKALQYIDDRYGTLTIMIV